MSDQAQGLRALANQARRDQHNHAQETAFPSADTVLTQEAVLGPPASLYAVADTRLRESAVHEERLSDGAACPPMRHARIIAVTSGKGGVGKTNFSSNLSLSLARTGKRVIVLDADLGLANLHVIMGVRPKYDLEHVMRGQKTLREVLHPGPGGVLLIAGGSGIPELANLSPATRDSFVQGMQSLDTLADIIIIDTGAGLSHNVMAFLCATQEVIVVTTPEPTALTDAYATIKVVTQENPTARLMIMVNMARSQAEAEEVASRLIDITSRFLHTKPEYLGFVPHDPTVAHAVRTQRPFALAFPDSAAARAIVQIAAKLGIQNQEIPPTRGIGGLLQRMQQFVTRVSPNRNRTTR